MNVKPNNIEKAAKIAARQMANRNTPFIYNEWYVAGLSGDIGEDLFKRTILGKQIVFCRKAEGTVFALQNRCPHRAFPLSEGIRDGDTIICGYHGMRFDEAGECLEVPATGRKPQGMCVRKFPIVEQNPLVWIWMGDPELADENKIPVVPVLGDEWRCSRDYMHLKANYVYLHENLLDLSHLSFLHRNTFGTADYAKTPCESVINDDEISIRRAVMPTTLPPVWANTTGITGENQAARITRTTFVAPGLQLVDATFYDVTVPEEERPDQRIITAHIPTPETQTTTHYFIVHGRNFAREDDEVTTFMHEQLMAAFAEDVVGLAAQEEVLASSDDDFVEISVATDATGVAMRRLLKKRSDEERLIAEGK